MCSKAFIETYFRRTPHSLQARMGAYIVETGIAVAHNGEVPRTDAWRGAMREAIRVQVLSSFRFEQRNERGQRHRCDAVLSPGHRRPRPEIRGDDGSGANRLRSHIPGPNRLKAV